MKAKKKLAPASKGTESVSGTNYRAKVRMYRQGLGDCFLITLRRKSGKPYFIMIDCGVILGTPSASETMTNVVDDIIFTTKGHVDLLIVTHEHWDHLSGFLQAKDALSKLTVDEVWLGWTENPDDPLARKLRSEHQAIRRALAFACARLRFGGASDSIPDGMMEFFGAAGQGTTEDALKVVKDVIGKGKSRFCLPKDPPVEIAGTNARLYVLGPPHDEKAIKRYNPSKSHPETYEMAAVVKLAMSSTDSVSEAPFDVIAQIPNEIARQISFFQNHYWGEDADSEEKNQSWRQIEGDWLNASSNMALQLDSATNNTSLVIAIELGGGDVLLFAADAQVGNWLSWQNLTWNVHGRIVSGPELLERTILYKTGHHGSHNATLQEKGLELMKNLRFALIPVDHEMAVKKRWGKMPLEQLEKRLNEITNGCVLRIDKDVPSTLTTVVEQDKDRKLYYELSVS
jgi:hypothetical protein